MHPTILSSITSSVGTPIFTEFVASESMFDCPFGHFARVFVYVDLARPLVLNVLVERWGCTFFVDIKYKNLPTFCSLFKVVGHGIGVCKKGNKRHMEDVPTAKPKARKDKNYV